MRPLFALLVAALAILARSAGGQTLSADQLARVDFEQRLGATIPLNAQFRDETGATVRLGNYFGKRPAVLVLVYYRCPNLCTVVLSGLLASLRDLRQDVGRDFDVIVVSIQPDESAKLASEKKQMYAARYGRPGTAAGWHFLTGDAGAISQLSAAIGFHSVYEPHSRQYAHPSGIVVVTPRGTISRYFLGIEYPPKDLRLALSEASESKIGSLANRLLLLCFHYDPNTGRYSLLISRVMQAAGMGTVLFLGGFIWRLIQHDRRKERVT